MAAFGAFGGGTGIGFDEAGLSKKEKSAVAHASDFEVIDVVSILVA